MNSIKNPSFRFISEHDRGISDAFNKGLSFARGDYIVMLNSADYFCVSNVYERLSSVIDNSQKEIDMVSFRAHISKDRFMPKKDDFSYIYNTCNMPHQATFVSRKLYNLVGEYSEEYKIRMDLHFFARCRGKKASFIYIPKTIVEYEPGGVSMKKENKVAFWKEGLSVKMLYNIRLTIKDYYYLFILGLLGKI